VLLFALLGLDPILQVFTWFSGVATLSVALLMAVTSIAVVVYFARTGQDRRLWNTVIAPTLGFIGLLVSAIMIGLNFPFLIGDVNAAGEPSFGVLTAVLLGLIVLFPLAGLLQAFWLKRNRPAVYDQITDAIGA
jgi:hypothetical protein